MSTLSDRLRGIVGGSVPRLAPDQRIASARPHEAAPIRSPSLAGTDVSQAAAMLGGRVVTHAAGAVIVVDRHYGVTDRHGRVPIGDITATLLGSQTSLSVLAPGFGIPAPDSRSDPSPLWFLDLETTGLAGGAGTQAFLVGCACLDGDGVSVRQFLLPGYEHERALLAEVTAWTASRGALVTFNGKSFDVPLIETRYLFHRAPFPLEGVTHLDMLHPARRLWRARGTPDGSADASCSLGTLERLLAGVHRVGDVPGFEIPSRYFQFVRDGQARPLEAVLEHNRLDLISLALVMARALTLIERGPASARDGYECLGLGRLYDRAGRTDEADAAYVRAIEWLDTMGRDRDATAEALRRLAWCRRRAGRPHEAAAAWQRLADLPGCAPAIRREAREALAIFHEHRARDLETAHGHARVLLSEHPMGRRRDQAEHRLRRIERKMEGKRPGAGLWPDA